MQHNEKIKFFSINDEEIDLEKKEEAISLLSKTYNLTFEIDDTKITENLIIKFQRSYHPTKICINLFNKEKTEEEEIYLKSNTDILDIKINKKINKIEILINDTYDMYNRLVIYEYKVI